MTSTEAITHFLSKTLEKASVDRYVGFVSKPKTQSKFLRAIYHDLSNRFSENKVTADLPEAAWSMSAFIYKPEEGFGIPCSSLRDVYDRRDDAILAVSQNGKYGFYREETMMDSERIFIA